MNPYDLHLLPDNIVYRFGQIMILHILLLKQTPSYICDLDKGFGPTILEFNAGRSKRIL